MDNIGKKHEDLLTNTRRIVNIDEASVATEFEIYLKVLSDSRSKYSGAKSTVLASRGCKHVVTVIATTTSGHGCLLFLLVAGKLFTTSWFDHLDPDVVGSAREKHKKLLRDRTNPMRFACNDVELRTDKWSLKGEVLQDFIQNVNKFAEQISPTKYNYVSILNNLGSRKGIAWVEYAREGHFQAMLAPANMSPFS